jgi:hypothetical protein
MLKFADLVVGATGGRPNIREELATLKAKLLYLYNEREKK